jgi:hypothetical protein
MVWWCVPEGMVAAAAAAVTCCLCNHSSTLITLCHSSAWLSGACRADVTLASTSACKQGGPAAVCTQPVSHTNSLQLLLLVLLLLLLPLCFPDLCRSKYMSKLMA